MQEELHSHEFSAMNDYELTVYQHGNLNFILTAFECHIYLKWCWRWWSNWNCINQLSINCRRYTLATGGIPRVANILKISTSVPIAQILKLIFLACINNLLQRNTWINHVTPNHLPCFKWRSLDSWESFHYHLYTKKDKL